MLESNLSCPKKTVLVVDDDEICRCVTSEILENLTVREKEIVRHIIDGWKSKEIAESLFISIKTVDKHRSNILGKLGINSSNQLRHGSLFLPED